LTNHEDRNTKPELIDDLSQMKEGRAEGRTEKVKGEEMKIQITDDYIMTSDADNFILNESHIGIKGKCKGKLIISPIAFYPTITALLEGLIMKKLKQSTADSIKTLLRQHTELVEGIKGLFNVGITGIGTMPCEKCEAKRKLKKEGR